MEKSEFLTISADQTKKLGSEYAQKMLNGGVLLLFGDLGSGKTTFTQGFASGLKIKKNIISPTFLIIRTYEIPNNIKGKFYHLDLYRLEKGLGVNELGIDELFNNSNNIVAIEWADRLINLPQNRTELYFEYENESKRKIIEKSYDTN